MELELQQRSVEYSVLAAAEWSSLLPEALKRLPPMPDVCLPARVCCRLHDPDGTVCLTGLCLMCFQTSRASTPPPVSVSISGAGETAKDSTSALSLLA